MEQAKLLKKNGQEAPAPSGFESCMTACCCLSIRERDAVGSWMLNNDADLQPSLMQRLCFCQCGPRPREAVPEFLTNTKLKGLAGVTIQDGDHSTAGSLQTLRFVQWDAAKRQATLPVFGGSGPTGVWSEKIVCKWACIVAAARLGNYTYRFTFDEEYKRAAIDILINPLCFCGFCCVPAWCAMPRSMCAFDMVRQDDHGTHWDRVNSCWGSEFKHGYSLKTVFTAEGVPGKYHAVLAEKTPQMVMVTY